MTQLQTVSKNDVEIFQAGSWNGDHYSIEDLRSMVNAFGKLGFQPPIKAGHEGGQETDDNTRMRLFGEPALGYVRALRVVGDKLVADLKDIPKRFANLINAGAFNRISSEIYWNYKDDNSGKIYPRVLKAIAFLGAKIPALTSLNAIESLYARQSSTRVGVCEYQLTKERSMDAETQIIELAKNYERNGMNTLESYRRVLKERPDLARAYECRGKIPALAAGDELHFFARKHMSTTGERDYMRAAIVARRENPTLARQYDGRDQTRAGVSPRQQLGALISDAVARGDIAKAVATAALYRPLCKATAGQWFQEELNRNSPGWMDNYEDGIRLLQQKYPGVTEMWNSGVVSEAAIRTIYGQWFKTDS